MNTDQFFHNVEASDAMRKFEQGLKKFPGTGQPYIRIPGVLKVNKVFIGVQEIPEFRQDQVLIDPAGTQTETIDIPIWKYAVGPDGVPILMRSKVSHDGIWQSGVDIYIDGEFDDDAVASDTPSAQKATPQQKADATKAVNAAQKALDEAKTDDDKLAAQLVLDQAKSARAALDQ